MCHRNKSFWVLRRLLARELLPAQNPCAESLRRQMRLARERCVGSCLALAPCADFLIFAQLCAGNL